LAARIDDISRRLPGFFIGRYDLRYASEADLRAGTNFQIIELNGAASEATSIYEARSSVVAAYRTLFRQRDLVFAIGAANRRRSCAPTRLSVLWRSGREYSARPTGSRGNHMPAAFRQVPARQRSDPSVKPAPCTRLVASGIFVSS
jgi:hypothetical protein